MENELREALKRMGQKRVEDIFTDLDWELMAFDEIVLQPEPDIAEKIINEKLKK